MPAGTILGILGRTGAGKSTLVNLLPRVLDPPPGTVFVDGADVRSYDLAGLRGAISVVPQETFLFSASIRENIGFGAAGDGDRPGAGAAEGRLERVAAISTIERDFRMLPSGWQTVVGERGVTLSGGQKQRVAISRALARDAAIYILDDSLSSVDTETEDVILRELLPFVKGRTVILISHRISTLKAADRIVVLEGGPRRAGRHARGARAQPRLLRRHLPAPAARGRREGRDMSDTFDTDEVLKGYDAGLMRSPPRLPQVAPARRGPLGRRAGGLHRRRPLDAGDRAAGDRREHPPVPHGPRVRPPRRGRPSRSSRRSTRARSSTACTSPPPAGWRA